MCGDSPVLVSSINFTADLFFRKLGGVVLANAHRCCVIANAETFWIRSLPGHGPPKVELYFSCHQQMCQSCMARCMSNCSSDYVLTGKTCYVRTLRGRSPKTPCKRMANERRRTGASNAPRLSAVRSRELHLKCNLAATDRSQQSAGSWLAQSLRIKAD